MAVQKSPGYFIKRYRDGKFTKTDRKNLVKLVEERWSEGAPGIFAKILDDTEEDLNN